MQIYAEKIIANIQSAKISAIICKNLREQIFKNHSEKILLNLTVTIIMNND